MNAQLRSILLFALISLALITQIGASCTNTDTTRSDDRETLDNSISIPRDARKVAEGSGALSYVARADGRVYLYDINDRVVIDNRTMRRDERYSVNPDQNRIQIDNKKVSDQDLKRKHDHRIYYLANDRRDNRDDRDALSDRLPRDARSVATGNGEISYKVRERGRVFIVDADDDRVLLSRDVYKDQTVQVDPDNDRVLIDGKKVYDNNLERKHAHRIYFEKD
jgi:hypothetical protein